MSSDGKLYDAYISYVNNDHDRKFVNFILKPHLENKNAYKVHLNENDILPGSGKIKGSLEYIQSGVCAVFVGFNLRHLGFLDPVVAIINFYFGACFNEL